MKIVFMGTPEIARHVLQVLVDAGHEVAAVLTQPDRPKGRKGELTPSPVKELALTIPVPVYQPLKLRQDMELIDTLKAIAPDVVVVIAFGQILSKEVLDIPKFGCMNIHTSLLPKYRGAAPIQQAIIDGEEETGVTIQYMAEGIDTGDIIVQTRIPISDTDTGETLTEKLAHLSGIAILEALKQAEAGTIVRVPQDDSKATYVKKMDKTFGEMDFTKSAKELSCFIRGLIPWPNAYTKLDGKMLKIYAARAVSAEEEAKIKESVLVNGAYTLGDEYRKVSDYAPGLVVGSSKKELFLSCGEGILGVSELQIEGKKRMAARDFLRGFLLVRE